MEVTTLREPTGREIAVVEAASSSEALGEIRRQRGEGEALGWELLGPGVRAFDLERQRRYLVVPDPPGDEWFLGEDGCEEPPPSFEVLIARDHEATAELPLTYRERGVRVASHVSRQEACALLRHLLDQQRAELACFPPGQVIELAVFTGLVDVEDLPPPLATLSYRDWRGAADLGFPGGRGRPERLEVGGFAWPSD